jgi:hypothetical protein
MILISRTEAKKQGLTRYFTGKPCAKGHVSERLTYNWMCAECNLEHVKNRYRKNPQKIIQRAIQHNKDNPEKARLARKKWKEDNPNKVQQESARRRAKKLQRTPSWINDGQLFEIECIYKYCSALRHIGLDYEVDHIIPMQGESVSGLHVPWNLQVLTAFENGSKGNRLW